jgi:hypothetical protein
VFDPFDFHSQLLDAGPDQEQPTANKHQGLHAECSLKVDSEDRSVKVVKWLAGEAKHPADHGEQD